MPEVRAQLAKMREFVTGVHQGRVLGFTGARFTDVVNIGIGGSDLGIVMATEALATLPQSRHPPALRVERRRRRSSPRRSRTINPATHAVRRLLEDVHDAGDAGQRQRRARSGWSTELGEKAHRRITSSRCRPTTPRWTPSASRRRARFTHVGLGRRPLLAVVGGRPVDRARARHGPVRADARRRRTRWTSTSARRRSSSNLPVLMGLLGVWNSNFLGLRFAGRAALRPAAAPLPGVPAAARDGVERQERDARRRAGRLRDRRRGLGRARQQRAALVLPAAAPGHGAGRARFHRAGRTARAAFQPQQDLALANCFAQAEAFAFGQTPSPGARGPAGQGPARQPRSSDCCRTRCTPATGPAA